MAISGPTGVVLDNRQLVLKTILDNGPLSRIELAHQANLSPSTVSRVVAYLMTEGILAEDTARVQTSGRSRIPIILNPGYGTLALVEVSATSVAVEALDMRLAPLASIERTLPSPDGDTVFATVVEALRAADEKARPTGRLRGVALVYADDLQRDGLMAAPSPHHSPVPLDQALATALGVPVVLQDLGRRAESSIQDLADERARRNHVLVTLGARVLVGVVQDGRPVPLHDGAYADVTDTCFASCQGQAQLVDRLVSLLTLLCSLFTVCAVFVGSADADEDRPGLAQAAATAGTGLVPAARASSKEVAAALARVEGLPRVVHLERRTRDFRQDAVGGARVAALCGAALA